MPPSPCINVCRMDPRTQLCTGCLRTLDEIARWSSLDEQTQRAILHSIEARRQQLPQAPQA